MTAPHVDDDRLLALLATALDAAPVEPSPAELAAFQRVVLDLAASPIDSVPGRAPLRTRVRRAGWLRRPLPALALAGVLASTATAAVAVTGADVPAAVRTAARAVGLPVEPSALDEARASLHRLRDALATADRAAVADAAAELRDKLARLTPAQRRELEPDASADLARADALLAPIPAPAPVGRVAPPRPITSPPAETGPDDHGTRTPTVEGHDGGGAPGPGPGDGGEVSGDGGRDGGHDGGGNTVVTSPPTTISTSGDGVGSGSGDGGGSHSGSDGGTSATSGSGGSSGPGSGSGSGSGSSGGGSGSGDGGSSGSGSGSGSGSSSGG